MNKYLPLIFFWMLLVLTSQSYGQKQTKMIEVAEIETSHGKILIGFYEATPLHKANFIKLAEEGFYDGCLFHRVIQNFVIQGGDPNTKDDDPNNDGQGGPGYTIPAEFNPLYKHVYGAVASARMGDNVNPKRESNGSQFYIVVTKKGTPHLDGTYTVFGKVISGIEVAEAIAEQTTDSNNKPVTDIPMTVKIVSMHKKVLKKNYNFVP